MPCQFCDIINKETERIIKEGKYTFVVLSNPKLMDGHLLVIPKRHVERLSELDKAERDELFEMTIGLQEKVLENLASGCDICEHYRPFIPDNKFKVSHLHMHIRPRSLDDELYTKVQKLENQVFKEVTADEVEKYKNIFG